MKVLPLLAAIRNLGMGAAIAGQLAGHHWGASAAVSVVAAIFIYAQDYPR